MSLASQLLQYLLVLLLACPHLLHKTSSTNMEIRFKYIFQLLNWNSLFVNTEIKQIYLIYINIKVFIEKFNTAPTPYRSGCFTGFIEGI